VNQRELSEKLEALANKLDELYYDSSDLESELRDIAVELRKLSNENYAPGNSLTWDAVKPKKAKSQGGFISKSGRQLPF